MLLHHDLKLGLRFATRSPLQFAVAVAILALGIGVNEAAFSLLNAVLLRPLPFRDADQLVLLYDAIPEEGLFKAGVTMTRFAAICQQARIFSSAAAYIGPNPALGFDFSASNELPVHVEGAVVSAGFLSLLGVEPVAGHAFLPSDDNPSAQAVILGWNLSVSHFGSAQGAVGRSVVLNRRVYRVVGVMSEGFDFPDRAQLWVAGPENVSAIANMPTRLVMNVSVIGRLRRGVPMSRARAALTAIPASEESEFFASSYPVRLRIVPLREALAGNLKPVVLLLCGAAAMILLIACADVANLLLARATARAGETVVRRALGATGLQLAGQTLVECAIVACVGGGLGLLVAFWAKKLLLLTLSQESPWPGFSGADATLVGAGFLFAAITTLLCSLAPLSANSKADLAASLKGAGQGAGSGPRASRLPLVLIGVQSAMAAVLLFGAGAMILGLYRFGSNPLGFSVENVVYASLSPRGQQLGERQCLLLNRMLDDLRAMPGVRAAALSSSLPFQISNRPQALLLAIEGGPSGSMAAPLQFDCASVSPGYFRAMGIRLERGRSFNIGDANRSDLSAVVDTTFASQFWPGKDPVGRRLTMLSGKEARVVGLVRAVRSSYLKPPEPMIYFPYGRRDAASELAMNIILRVERDPRAYELPLRGAIHDIDPSESVQRLGMLAAAASGTLAEPRGRTIGLLFFALLGLALGAGGVFGVSSYMAQRSVREMAIRVALGARPAHVVRLTIQRTFWATLAGLGIGVAAGLALNRLVEAFFYGAHAASAPVCIAAGGALLGSALLSSYIPALRASRVDPMTALRAE